VGLDERTFAPPAQGILVSGQVAARNMVFLRLPRGWDEPVHTTPTRQTLICLAGSICATASDGEAREIGPGDVWLMDDLTGKGHQTRVTSEADFDAVIVQHD
jgi:hypothetical protein